MRNARPCFLGKIEKKNIINLSFADLAHQKVEMVNVFLRFKHGSVSFMLLAITLINLTGDKRASKWTTHLSFT